MKYTHITELIGNTPLLEIDPTIHGIKNLKLYAKLEYMNPFGSVKDRAVWGMLRDDIVDLKENHKTIIEMSSGNTAKAIQGIAGTFGIPFKTITNRIKVDEVRDILQIMGATIQELPGKSDCHDPNDPNDPLVYIHQELEKDKGKKFFTSQYDNQKNLEEHYRTTGEEILKDLQHIDYYFAGLGTTGSSRGPAQKIKERDHTLKTYGVVATKNDYIPGIRTKDEIYEVGLLDPTFYEDIIAIDSLSALKGTFELVRKAGIMSGPTGGAVYQTLKEYFKKHPPQEPTTAVFIVCDRMEWYVSYIKKRMPELWGNNKKLSWKDTVIDGYPLSEISMTAHEVETILDDPSYMIIDMRTPRAFAAAHIRGSINLPYEYLDSIFEEDAMPFGIGKKIIFVCAVGQKSLTLARYMRNKGAEAFSLTNGITAWNIAELELCKTNHEACVRST